jgi:hypothetical protein
MRAASITVDGIIEANVRAIVVRDNGAGFGLLEDFQLGCGRLAQPLDRVLEPRVRRIIYVTHKERDYLEASGGAEIYRFIVAAVRKKR